jgi:hypothetical protein
LVHKERNIRAKLSKRHWGELARLFKRLREVQGKQAAEDVVKELVAFLTPLNADGPPQNQWTLVKLLIPVFDCRGWNVRTTSLQIGIQA